MKILGIRSNILLNGLRIVLGSAIGLITMPLINKTIGVSGVGKVEYVYSIINYFILFSAFGIPIYGIREVSKLKESPSQKSKLLLELIMILSITTILAYSILFVMIFKFEFLYDLKLLVVIMSAMILFSNLGMEWFYQAIEDQLFITIRFIFFTLASFILLLILVKESDDYLFYAITLVFTSAGSGITNIFFLRKHIDLNITPMSSLEFTKHLMPLGVIFMAQFLVSMYLQFDIILLGSIAGLESVAYYAVANKLIRFIISLITIIGVVSLPRLMFLIEKDKNEYLNYVRMIFGFILIVSMPIFILIAVFSKDIIFLMAGNDFSESVLIMQILSPMCVIVGVAYFLSFLVLFPQGLERKYTFAVGVTALFSVSLNMLFVNYFRHNATAVIAICSEILATLIMIRLAREELRELKLINFNMLKTALASLVLSLVAFLFSRLAFPILPRMILVTLFGLFCYVVTLIALREKNILKEYAFWKLKLFLK
jgi:O-antigen/teichoic acid export membrane protein